MRPALTTSPSSFPTGCVWRSREAVPDVLLVELGDLQLGEEKLGEWDRLLLERQAVTEPDLVRHAESGDEDVDLPPVLVVEEEEALVPVQRVEGNVGLVSLLAEQARCGACARTWGHEVEIVVVARQQRRDAIWGA
jgi:hypothetical protein